MLNVKQGLTTIEVNGIIRKKITEYSNDDQLVLNSSGVVLEVNIRGKDYYKKTMTDIVERTYRYNFHLQYRNQSNDSKNRVIYKLQETFTVQLSMRHVKLAIAKTYNSKKESLKR